MSKAFLQDLILAFAGLLAAVGALLTFSGNGYAGAYHDWADLVVATSAALVGLLESARVTGRLSQAWRLLGLAVASWAIGDVLWVLAPQIAYGPAHLYDAFYLVYYPLFLAGVLRFPAAPWRQGEAVRTSLDLVIAMLGATMVVWQEILAPTAARAGISRLEMLVVASFPVGDLVLLLALGLLLLRRPTQGVRASLRWLATAVALEVIADLGYLVLDQQDLYAAGSAIDVIWVAGLMCLALAARVQGGAEGSDDTPATPLPAATAVPYLGILLGFGLVAELAWRGRATAATHLAMVLGGAATLCGLVILRQVLAQQELDRLTDRLTEQNERLREEQERSERLLLNILPAPIAERLKAGREGILADQHAEATVLFADLVGFTALASVTPAPNLVRMLNDVFSRFDRAADRHGLEKIKTIGDSYMAVAGVPDGTVDHAGRAVRAALDLLEAVRQVNAERGLALQLRIGLHSGPLVAGVIGEKKFIYDLWGDTVNIASRMESHGEPGRVHVSDATRGLLGEAVRTSSRGTIEVKGRGPMPTWFVEP